MPEEKKISEPSSFPKIEWKKLLSHKWVVRNIPYFLFLALLAVAYIYNGHYNDKMTRKISESEKQIKELEFEYKSVKSQVIYRSKPSELANAVGSIGLKELTRPPVILEDSVSATP